MAITRVGIKSGREMLTAQKRVGNACVLVGCDACLVKPANVTVQITGLISCPGIFGFGPFTAVCPLFAASICQWVKNGTILYGGVQFPAFCRVNLTGLGWQVLLTSGVSLLFSASSSAAGCHDARTFTDTRVCTPQTNDAVGGTCVLTPGP